MKNIPIGFDLRWNSTDLDKALDAVLDSSLAKNGFEYIILPSGSESDQLCIKIHEAGKKAGIALSVRDLDKETISISTYDYIELQGTMEELIPACKHIRKLNPSCFLTILTNTDELITPPDADAWRIDSALADDFFELTRNILDSCLGNGAEDCNDYPSASRERAKRSSETDMYCIPAVIPVISQFDAERMRAILSMIAILRSPLFLTTTPDKMTKDQIEMLLNPVWKEILETKSEAGGALRYYDPWHGLFSRPAKDNRQWLLILNRCHGDTPTDIQSKDVALQEGEEFELYDLYEKTKVASVNGAFSIHVETSDHPETPCCRLYETA